MKDLRRILLTGIFLSLFAMSVMALETGTIEYKVPINYKYLDENAINNAAENYFKAYMETNDENMLKKMLSAYCLLTNINKENPLYFVRVGIAYDKLKNDRYAKSYFGQSMCIQNRYPYTYSAFGDFWYERCRYRKALKNYLLADDYGYSTDYDNLVKVGKCFEKLGDYSSAIDFYKKALSYHPENEELPVIIQNLELKLQQNSLYNERERRLKY